MLSDWELDLFSALARHDLLLARARMRGDVDMAVARVQLLLAISRARQASGDDLHLLRAVEHFLVERDADLHSR